ncbi:MAG: electron transfer flavoprotein-ubiquinone oxidoreductase [Bacteroidales bacterium]|jgi:electron-transferring-flavoprotein dehydrogenase|nr:electron transfer flavoprotein-ubiquinone oxidoreductase [Bacteroidales bacterium]
MENKNYNIVDVLIVGAGPAGLTAAATIKKRKPELSVCVIDKAHAVGNHNLSGAVLEPQALHEFLNYIDTNLLASDEAKTILERTVTQDNINFFTSKRLVPMQSLVHLAKILGFNIGAMSHKGDYIVSISQLTKWFAKIAASVGVEILHGFSVSEIVWDKITKTATGVRLVDQGWNKEGEKQQNFIAGEVITAKYVILAEGVDGTVTRDLIQKAGLTREHEPLFSIGVKELIQVSPEQYEKFTKNRVVHALGYPIFKPFTGLDMFGGGIMYPYDDNCIAVGMIVGLDWKEKDFNPQDALALFKEHKFVKQFIENGTIVETGAKMIPEGGYRAIPRNPETNAIGCGNIVIIGDSAGLVNMIKIKGLHNAIRSGMIAAQTLTHSSVVSTFSGNYTKELESSPVMKEMRKAQNFRQTVAKFGNLIGMPLSILGNLLPKYDIEADYKTMTSKKYKLKGDKTFDKANFTALALIEHREEQPSHLKILNAEACKECAEKFNQPCVVFCPAGVYEDIHGTLKPANASNCLHCKTCQRKCPYDNIRWTVPEGGGGPRYKRM